jgi:hypothetical protein
MAKRRTRVIRQMIVKTVPTVESTPRADFGWDQVSHLAVLAGIALVLWNDNSWYWLAATVLTSGPDAVRYLVPHLNHLFVLADVYLGGWVEQFATGGGE